MMTLLKSMRAALIVVGLTISLPFFVWLALGFLFETPTLLDVFSISGIRIPAGITILGLLLTTIGFEEI